MNHRILTNVNYTSASSAILPYINHKLQLFPTNNLEILNILKYDLNEKKILNKKMDLNIINKSNNIINIKLKTLKKINKNNDNIINNIKQIHMHSTNEGYKESDILYLLNNIINIENKIRSIQKKRKNINSLKKKLKQNNMINEIKNNKNS